MNAEETTTKRNNYHSFVFYSDPLYWLAEIILASTLQLKNSQTKMKPAESFFKMHPLFVKLHIIILDLFYIKEDY